MLSGKSLSEFEELLANVEPPEAAHKLQRGVSAPRPRSALTAAQWVNQNALLNIELWAPIAFPQGTMHATGAWRVRSDDQGRHYEEDLSIAPGGIRDWGQEVSHTAIDLISKHFSRVTADGELEPAELDNNGDPIGNLSPDEAARWLCDQLSLDWDALLAEDISRPASGDDLSHDALAIRFANLHAEDMRFVPTMGKWFEWDGIRWCPDEKLNAMTLARQICQQAARQIR